MIDTPTVLITNTVAEFKAEGYENTSLQVTGSESAKRVTLSFLKSVPAETTEETTNDE